MAGDVIGLIQRTALLGDGPTAIKAKVDAYLLANGRAGERPHLNTVEKYARPMRTTSSPAWRWEQDTTGIPGRILEATGELIERSEGRVRVVSVAAAARMAVLIGTFPDIPAWEAYQLARLQEAGRTVADYLAFTPWRDGGRRYLRAVDRGWASRAGYTDSVEPALREAIESAAAVHLETSDIRAILGGRELTDDQRRELLDHAASSSIAEERNRRGY